MKRLATAIALGAAALGCTPNNEGAAPRTWGPEPELGAPKSGLLPTINVAPAVGWAAGAAPKPAAGLAVARYAEGLAHPRWLYLLPNGDVLVAQACTQTSRGGGATTMVANAMQKRAGAICDNADRITLLRDSDGDGDVDETHLFRKDLNQPIGMALVGEQLYIANTDALLRFAYAPGALKLEGAGETVTALPGKAGAGGHWTRTLLASPDGRKLHVTVGSASNIAEGGLEAEAGRAAVWEVDLATGGHRLFATGLRNPVGIDREPVTGAIWVAVNERDMLGDDLVPDYMTSLKDGGFYGWPWSYFGANVDARVTPPNPEKVAQAIKPDYALGAHTASLGLHFYRGALLPERYRGGAVIGQHGSWNRRERSGYKVVFVPFAAGKPSGPPEDLLGGFLDAEGRAQGRPVGVIEDRTGAILVADDVGGIIWRVAPGGQ